MSDVIIIIVLAAAIALGVRESVKHFKGEGGCCGGGSSYKPKKKKLMSMDCQSICSMIWTPLRKASKIIAPCWTVFGVSCTEVSI